jgi:hypothetical protein
MNRKSKAGFAAGLLLIVALVGGLVSACGGDDKGTCTIFTSGDDIVIENITSEECQTRFVETGGATGFKWDPN